MRHCVQRVVAQLPVNDRRTFLRSLAAGVLAAIGASLLYMLVLHILPESVGSTLMVLAGIGIGWAIGKAMRWAARKAGGRRYQWTGSVLAYASVVYSLHTILLGTVAAPWWAFPLILLSPVTFLFTEMKPLGALEIFAACLAIRWAWSMLREPYNPIGKIPARVGSKV